VASGTSVCGRAASTRAVPAQAGNRVNLPRPIFVSVGRVAVEREPGGIPLLDLPGTKVVIGDGPQEASCAAAS
jgi:hypothetical protein